MTDMLLGVYSGPILKSASKYRAVRLRRIRERLMIRAVRFTAGLDCRPPTLLEAIPLIGASKAFNTYPFTGSLPSAGRGRIAIPGVLFGITLTGRRQCS